jgi:hypothetical protein
MQVRVYIDSPFESKKLLSLHPDIVWFETDYVEIMADIEKLSEITGAGLTTEIIHEDVVQFYQSRLHEVKMGAYRDLGEIYEKIDSIYAANPAIVSPKMSIGLSLEGRDIWAFKISDNPTVDEEEPEILYTACMHAREVITPEILFYFIDYILGGYGFNSIINDIVDNRELWFIPMVNPDGYFWNEMTEPAGGGMWRKNRRDNGDGTYGVDLNRNWGHMWGYDDDGSSPDTWDETYRGAGPFSEPETQVLRDFIISREFAIALNYHAYSNLYLWPWGYSTIPCPDDHIFGAMGQVAAMYNGYAPIPGWQFYSTNGGANDWYYGEQTLKNKIYSYTVEVGYYSDGFWPAAYRIPELISENLLPNIYFAQVADNPFYSDNAGPGIGACYNEEPFILDVEGDTSLTITMYNDGRHSYDNNFNVWVLYEDGNDWVDVNPTSGIIPFGVDNTTDLTLNISAPPGAADPSLWRATVRIGHQGVSSPQEIPICLEVASNLMRPQYAELATPCKRFRVYNNGELCKRTLDASLDYIDECDTFNLATESDIYLYDASPVICRLGQGGDTLRFMMYSRMISAPDGLQPVGELQVDETSYPEFSYAEAEYKTADNVIGLKSRFYIPKAAEQCEFIAVTQEFRNLSEDTLYNVLIGVFLDWNIPSDSGAMNGSGIYIDTIVSTMFQPNDDTSHFATIYQHGAEFYDSLMGDCGQYSDDRIGGIIAAPSKIFKNARILDNRVYIETTGPYGNLAPLPPGAIYQLMKENNEFDFYEPYDEFDYPNLSTLVTFGEYDLPPSLTYTYTYVLLATRDGIDDYLFKAEAANGWVAAQAEIHHHCLDLAGDANNDGNVNIADVVFLVAFIFGDSSPPPNCSAEGDANADGNVNIGDAVYIANYVFQPGAPPPIPGPEK